MKNNTSDEDRLVRYLLGEVPQEERVQIEERYLADPDFHAELKAAELDLINRYVRGELAEREQFEKCFLSSPHRREKVEFVRALTESQRRTPARSEAPAIPTARVPSWTSSLRIPDSLRPLLIGGGLAVAVLAGGWFVMTSGPRAEVAQAPPQQQQPEQQPPSALPPASAPPAAPAAPAPVTFVLTPSALRNDGEEMPTVTVEGNGAVSLQLVLQAAGFKTYQAVVRSVEGIQVWQQSQLSLRTIDSRQAVVLNPPVARFKAGNYTVSLSGVGDREPQEVGNYDFKLVKRAARR